MKKIFIYGLLLLIVLLPVSVRAQSGCCSHHGGVSGCSSSGRQVCNDGTLSPSCTCTPSYVYGCTDSSAKNYDYDANKDDGSCTYYIRGCTDVNSINYNASAERDDGSCIKKVLGCVDVKALNYNESANVSDESCKYKEEVQTTESSDLESDEDSTASEESSSSDNVGPGIVGLSMIGATVYLVKKKNKKL